MRLKSLVIKGFKSFGDETVINFNEHVTGVVGPNGSGKSNIVDAVRWVLGEQSTRELRLERMSDVIFNGSKSKKSSKLAKVTLSFDNTKNILPTEYNTVSISRLLYHSGESEYRLNDVPCRLKDITSLFMDTGIGSNTYAIIALGMVDDILADKEHARRRMFEQASGISKYKIRKKETLSKLKSTSEDLDRVEDLLFELERNMKSLERQARNAKKYLELKKEYQDNSIQLALLSSQKFMSRIEDLDDQLQKEKFKYEDVQKRLKKEEASLQAEKLASLEREKELSQFQKQLNQQMTEISQMESQKQVKIQKLKFAEENSSRLELQINQGKKLESKLNEDISSLQAKLQSESKHEQKLKRESDELYREFSALKGKKESLKSAFDQKLTQKNKWDQQLFEFEKEWAVANNREHGLSNEISHYQEEISQKSKFVSEKKKKLTQLKSEARGLSGLLAELHKSDEERTEKMNELRASIEKLNKDLAQSRRKLDALQHEFKLLNSMIENMEGFPESSRFLHHHWDNQVPVLADVIDADEEVKAAVEQYLEPFLNHFIVKNIKQAIQAISLLSEAQKGKANFFVIDQISSKKENPKVNTKLIPARTLVNTDKAFENLLNQLLDQVYFFEGAIEDLKYTDEFDHITILSKRGDFIKSGFSLRGGSVGLFEGKKIGRKKHLEKLREKISMEKERHANIEERLSNLEIEFSSLDKNSFAAELEKKELNLRQLQSEIIQLEVSIENSIELETTNSKRLGSLESELANVRKEKVKWKSEIAQAQKQKKKFQKMENTGGAGLDDLNVRLSAASEKYNQSKIELIRKENELQSIQRDIQFAQRRLEETKIKLKADENQLTNHHQDRLALQKEIKKLEKDLIDLYQEKSTEENQLADFEEKFYASRSEIFDIEDRIRLLNKKGSDSQRTASELKEKITNNRFRINALIDRVQIEFTIDKDGILATPVNEDLDYSELEYTVEKLRNRLNRFGEINPMAVEAFETIQERHANITEQRDDILEAKDSLIETIQEIEQSATQQFLQSFSEVRENFRHVFRSLFTKEDDCDLIIEDPENPLESDIDIVAKPKGKRPKSLSQLSGGEKTLTATALLFALYLLKPAPFCILDEVDAPLDDANVQKFNTLVREFSRDSQFIVVTHNKATMAAVDVLYGVFMPEQGISKVTAVDFRSYDYEPTMQAVN